MTSKLFIAYSHLDEIFIGDFIKHISPLKDNGFVSEWYDRKIIGGKDYQKEIDSNFDSSDIICMFISANFLASDACINERKRAFLLRKKYGISVISIILSDCAWTDIKELSKSLAFPTDGKPISTFADQNTGWLDVYKGLKKAIEGINKIKNASITDKFQSFLNDSELLKRAHSNKTEVNISDIFVFPNLSKINYEDEKEDAISSENIFIDDFINLEKILIAGESQSGKTTLCKKIYLNLRSKMFFPIYIYDKTHRYDGLIKNRIEESFKSQYKDIDISDIDQTKIVLIFDGFHYVSSDKKLKIINQIDDYLYHILIVDDIFALNINDENLVKNYYRYRLDQFGPILRDKLIRKWLLLTDDRSSFNFDENDFYRKLDSATELVNTTIGKVINNGIMPSYPLFILSILSNYEAFDKPLDQEITSQGYCYQALIYIYLRKQGVKNDEIDIYINFLSVLAYYLFDNNISELSDMDFKKFLEEYNKKFFLPIKIETILKNLEAHEMFVKTSMGNYKFQYPYLYYYFVAKYFSDHINEMKNEISCIVNNLHKDENAYITIFISHHSKNNNLLNEIIFNALLLFENCKVASLSKKELEFFDTEIEYVVKAALPSNSSPEVERNNQLEKQEKDEKIIWKQEIKII